LGAAEVLATCWLFGLALPALLLLLSAFSAKTSSASIIEHKASVIKVTLGLSAYFPIDMICFLSLATVKGRQVKLPVLTLS